MKLISGFESTYIFGSGKDVLETTKHTEYFRQDLELVRASGLNMLRYSAPWHTIERTRGVYDWTWLDEALGCLREKGITPILDPLHHTSFPDWLKGGFASPDFVESYLQFIAALAERYPWVNHYTIVNEPFVTTWFCGHEGVWYPYKKHHKHFVPMILNVGEVICRGSHLLTAAIPDVKFIHVDASETHRALDVESEYHANKMNTMRFLVPDLVLGRINEEHPLYLYFLQYGASEERLRWFRENPGRIDILGLDYYSHCELEWAITGRVYPNTRPVGFKAVAMEYVNRYNLPVMLTETNIRGFVSDRISWLKFMVEQCEQLDVELRERGLSFEGFCWYPFIDSTDWDSLVRVAHGNIDPQGIFWLDETRRTRYHSELSEVFSALARGEITSEEIPAYRFQAPLDTVLENFLPMMSHWDWIDPNEDRPLRLDLEIRELEKHHIIPPEIFPQPVGAFAG